jgi:hypothetical protein
MEPQSMNVNFCNGSPLNDNDFTIVHFNINSITAEGRLEQLTDVCSVLKVDCLVITESKLSQEIPTSLISLSGYHEPVRKDRNRNGGGCLIYIKESLTFKQIKEKESLFFEHLWVDINIQGQVYSLNAFYRPPNESMADHTLFINEATSILTNLSQHRSDNKIIASDLNFGNCYCKFPVLPPKPLDNSAPELFSSFGAKQVIDIPTRLTETTTSLIDLIFVFNVDKVQCHGTLPSIADHEGTFICFHSTQQKPKIQTRTVYDYKNIDEVGLIRYLNEINYNDLVFSKPVSQQAKAYSDVLIKAREKFVLTKQITIRPCDQPWVSSYTRLLLPKKNKNYQLFKKDSSKLTNAVSRSHPPEIITRLTDKKQKSYKSYRSAANESCKANRRAKLAFFNSFNSTMHNGSISAKKKISILTKLIRTQKISTVPPIIENGEVITDSQEKANIFNNFFSQKATVSGNGDLVPPLLQKEDITSPINQFNTSPFELGHIIRNIKKSNNSYCGIPGKFLSIVATPVAFQLYKVFNNMFAAGIFPDVFKIGHICCVYKGLNSGLKSSKSSWRPITLLPTLSKVAESVLHKRLLDHFLDNNVISQRQAAYLKGDSTIQQVLYIVHLIRTTWSNKAILQGVFLDVSAAFDKAWHSGIIAKLEQVQIKNSALDLFKSYLSNRLQITVIDSKKSTIKQVMAGVPQGSRLGPLLWILYYNDIIDDLDCEVLIFADDICIFAKGNSPEETSTLLNKDLCKISAWATKWKVNFNPSKTKNMLFSNKTWPSNPDILFNNTKVEQVLEHKHLGLWLTPTLCWSKQVHEICMRANSKLAVLRSVHYLTRSTLDLLYKLQIRSVIDYGLCIYYHNLKQSDVYRLNQIQYRAGKLIAGALHFTSSLKLNSEIGLEELSDRAKFLGLTVFHKIHLGLTRPLIKTCMPNIKININNTRTSTCYNIFPKKYLNY